MTALPSGVGARLGFLAQPGPMTRAQRIAAAGVALENADWALGKGNASGVVKHLAAAERVLPRRGTPGTNSLWARHDAIESAAAAL